MAPGNVIIEVAGRPFCVFQGTVPAYRDMAPGESGSDIAQLQAGLEGLGFGIRIVRVDHRSDIYRPT